MIEVTKPRSTAAMLGMLAALGQGVLGCGAPQPPLGSGGVELEELACGRGLAVVHSDYQSTSVALLAPDGAVASARFISSASAGVQLTAPLSGDVVGPSSRIVGDALVLLDRFPAAVISWVDLASSEVRAQLDVSTGFAANPHDYLEVNADKAYLSRHASNPNAGAQAWDGGGDLLIVDPRVPSIVGRIDLQPAMVDAAGFLPRANRLARHGERVFVLASGYNAAFSDAAASRIITIDSTSDSIVGVTVLSGSYGCGGMALAAGSGGDARLAVSCSGRFGGGSEPVLGESAVVVLRVGDSLPEISQRFPASESAGVPFGFSLDWLDEEQLLVVGLGRFGEVIEPDRLIRLDVAGNSSDTLATSLSLPFELGDVRCMTPFADATADDAEQLCGGCFVSDAERRKLRPIRAIGGEVRVGEGLRVEDGVGLPPRGLIRF